MMLGSGIAVAVAVAGGYSFDSTPSLGLPYAMGRALKKTKKKKKKRKKERNLQSKELLLWKEN